jgi:hypothetical protein
MRRPFSIRGGISVASVRPLTTRLVAEARAGAANKKRPTMTEHINRLKNKLFLPAFYFFNYLLRLLALKLLRRIGNSFCHRYFV